MTGTADSPSTGRRVPDFFIAGHPKSGTTALYEMLGRHPQIYVPERKEPRYFADDLPSRYQPWLDESAAPETYEDYLALFDAARPDQMVGEGSTAYIWSHTAAARIAEVQPDARIVVLLREPASYLRSLHLQLLEVRTEEEPDLRRAIALEPARREGRELPATMARWPQVFMYSDHVRYAEQLRRFHAVFPRDQVLVLIYDDFRADNELTVRTVERFLGVDDTVALEPLEVNASVRVRSVRMDDTLNSVAIGRGTVSKTLRTTVKLLAPRQVRQRAHVLVRRRMLFAKPHPPDDAMMAELRRRFRPEVEEISEYLDRDLVSLWGYDAL
jgi:hypothetical protein